MLRHASIANKFKVYWTKLIHLVLVLQTIMQLSAKQRIGIGGVCLLIFKPSNFPEQCPSRNFKMRKFIHIINIYGERGSPCLIPLAGLQKLEILPLMFKDKEADSMQIMCGGRLNLWSTFLMKFHSNLS